MIWWLDNPARARAERKSIADLGESRDWLRNIQWQLSKAGTLSVDFDIEGHNGLVPLTMTFSAFHPNSPPIVVPRDGSRLSEHQYGAGGNLCLEYRADNWEPSITAAMMVESAYRLIAGETSPQAQALPSAHFVSVGQGVRGSATRFLLGDDVAERLAALSAGAVAQVGVAEKAYAETLTAALTDIDGTDCRAMWPSGLRDVRKRGYAIRLSKADFLPPATLDGIAAFLDARGLDDLKADAVASDKDFDLFLCDDHSVTHYYAWSTPERRGSKSRTVLVPTGAPRLPESYLPLRDKAVAIVGCGSLGSKIATCLVRSGVKRFVLVDDDLLFAENLVRNDLSAQGIGAHKVDALKARLTEIVGTLDVSARRVALGGQESADTTESVMAAISECDVVIDATANAHCFNFCAAVARANLRPMVWGEVLAGGIGGIVARTRPKHEPEPQSARNQIKAWCDIQGVPAPMADPVIRYGVRPEDGGPPWVADDAEVSIVAAHMARFAIDVLVSPEESIFPAPAYVIGLRKQWIIDAPFEVWPLYLVGAGPWEAATDSAAAADSILLIRELLPGLLDD